MAGAGGDAAHRAAWQWGQRPRPPGLGSYGPSPQRPRRGRRRHGGAVPQRGDDPGPALPAVRGRLLLCQRAGRAGEGPVPRRECPPPLAGTAPAPARRGRAAPGTPAPRSPGARAPPPSAAAVLEPSLSPQLNPDVNVFQRKFVNEVRRCEEMDRKLRTSLSLWGLMWLSLCSFHRGNNEGRLNL